MKLFLVPPNPSLRLRFLDNISWKWNLSKSMFISTDTITSLPSPSTPNDNLYRRISRAGDPVSSVIPILEEWLEQGKTVKKFELQRIIKLLRVHRRYTHALQLSEWMTDQKVYNLSTGDVAVQLDLISKARSLECGEKYFDSLPETSKTFQVYGALLNGYVHHRCLERAEAVMQKIRELGFLKSPLLYNVMLKLYGQKGEYEKLDTLIQEMEEKCISFNVYTYCIRLNAYAATSNIEEAEKTLMKMEVDPMISMDWSSYATVANCYLKAGLNEKCSQMLKRSEQLLGHKTRRIGYEHLLTMYAAAGNKDEVFRIWNLYKKLITFFNTGYLCMISALVKLDDLEGAERILEEWELKKSSFDIRILNLMVGTYSKKGLWKMAEKYVNKIIESGVEPDATTWDRLAAGYCVGGQMEKAVETIKKALLNRKRRGWITTHTLSACVEYLKGKGDVDGAEVILKIVKEHPYLSTRIYDNVVKYIAKGNLVTEAVGLTNADDHSLGGEAHSF